MVYSPTFPIKINQMYVVSKCTEKRGFYGFGCTTPLFASSLLAKKDLVEQTTPVATTVEDAGLTVSEAQHAQERQEKVELVTSE